MDMETTAKIAPKWTGTSFFEADLAATNMYGNRRELDWHEGSLFEIIPEPQNPVDSNAMLVLHNGVKSGYLAREFAARIHELMDAGWSLCGQAFLTRIGEGKFGQGVVAVKIAHPLSNWPGFNPGQGMRENIARFELDELGKTARKSKKQKECHLRKSL